MQRGRRAGAVCRLTRPWFLAIGPSSAGAAGRAARVNVNGIPFRLRASWRPWQALPRWLAGDVASWWKCPRPSRPAAIGTAGARASQHGRGPPELMTHSRSRGPDLAVGFFVLLLGALSLWQAAEIPTSP